MTNVISVYAREVKLDLKYSAVTLRTGSNKTGEPISLNYVGCSETGYEEFRAQRKDNLDRLATIFHF
jgi:hypothetical protein